MKQTIAARRRSKQKRAAFLSDSEKESDDVKNAKAKCA